MTTLTDGRLAGEFLSLVLTCSRLRRGTNRFTIVGKTKPMKDRKASCRVVPLLITSEKNIVAIQVSYMRSNETGRLGNRTTFKKTDHLRK